MKNKKVLILALTLAMGISLLAGCAGIANSSGSSSTTDSRAVISSDMESVEPPKEQKPGLKDDYYAVINEKLLNEHKDETWNHFYDLIDKAYEDQKSIIQSAAECTDKSSSEYKLSTLYLKAINNPKNSSDYYDRLFAPVMNADNLSAFLTELSKLQYEYGIDGIINTEVIAPDEDPANYAVYMKSLNYFLDAFDYQDGEEYEEAANENKEYFTELMRGLLKLSGKETAIDNVYEFVKSVALSEDSGVYKPVKLEELQKSLTNLDLTAYLGNIYKKVPAEVMAKDTAAYKKLNEYITEDNLEMLKNYVYMINLNKYVKYLGSDYVTFSNKMEETYIGDVEKIDFEKLAVKQVSELLKWDMGKLYTEKNFSEEKKQAVQKIVDEILAEYKEMLSAEDWLNDETKSKAIKKLENIKVRIGMPDNIEKYLSGYQPSDECYFADVMSIKGASAKKQFDRFTEKVDRNVWNVLPQDMTPCYYPTDNSINIPIVALEEPYFSLEYSDEKNLGAIGTIIGHEVTHAFDDLGSQYDENGDMVDWWTSEDRKAFNDRAEKIVTYYTSYKTPDTMQQDGKQTLGENIADLGSMNCLTRIVEHNGWNAESFFESYANIWASTMDGLSAAIVSGMDEHAADKVRVNAVLSSCELFVKTYGITESDKMFIDKDKRVKLW